MKAIGVSAAVASLFLASSALAQQKPSEMLSLFFRNHLDRILSPIGQPKPVPLPHARITQLREQFADQFSKAPDTDKAMYQAAVAVCDAVSSAMDERQKAIASLQASRAVHAPSNLGAQRKDIPTRGSLGDAELAGLELEREAHEEQNRKQDARQNDAFFNAQLKTNWSQHAAQLRQNINALYARERDTERMAAQAKATAVHAAPSPEHLTNCCSRRLAGFFPSFLMIKILPEIATRALARRS